MSQRKEVKFNASIDTAEFDKSIETMQKKLKELYAPSDMLRMQSQTGQRAQNMGFGGMSQPAQADFNRASSQAKREMDTSLREQIAGQDKLIKLISAREKALKDLKKQQDSMTKGSDEELKNKEKILKVEENLARQKDQYRQRDQALNQAMDAKQRSQFSVERLTTAYQNGGVGGAATAAGRMAMTPMGMTMGMGLLGAGVAGAGAALGTFSNYYRDYGRMPIDTNMALANAAQGSVGRDVSNIYGRRTGFEMPYMGERARASQHALEALRTGKNADTMDVFSSMLKWGGAGMGTGAGIGAGIGSIVPGVGTAIGAGVGAAVGGGIGGFSGLASAMSDPMKRALVMSKIPLIGGQYEKKYNSMLAEKTVSDYGNDYEAQKNQNPFKKAAIGDFEQNYMRNLSAQRMMGMGNDQFYGKGGYLQSGTDAGFTPELSLQMSQGIIGAGGSTRAAGNSVFGNQMSRGLNMTNAANVLGSLSGSMGSDEATRGATIKILAEGMRLGLDDSKFAEENRRFTQAAADIVAKTGLNGADDASRNAGKFANFVGDNTNSGVAAAQNAYQEYQGMSSSTTGPRGVMRASGFMSDSNLSQLSTMDKQALMQMPESDIGTSSPFIQGLASKYGMDAQDLVDSVGKVNKNSQNRYKEGDQLRDKIKAGMSKAGVTQLNTDTIGSLPKDVQSDISSLQSYQMNEYGYGDAKTAQARTFGTVNGTMTPSDIQSDREKVINAKMQGDTGKIEDHEVAAAAGDSATVLKNFNELRPSLDNAAKSAAAFTDKIREMNAELMAALESSRTGDDKTKSIDAVKKMFEQMSGMGNQPQSSKVGK